MCWNKHAVLIFVLVLHFAPVVYSRIDLPSTRSELGALPLSEVDAIVLPPVDNQKLLEIDKKERTPNDPFRFAYPLNVQVTPKSRGTWETLKDGTRLWRLEIVSAGALSLNLGFTRYSMPPGGRMYLYDFNQEQIIGPFTEKDNEEHGQLWTPLLITQEMVIEVHLPESTASKLELALTSVNHGYVDFTISQKLNSSGSCNVDVVCPEGDPWRDQIRSVGAYTVEGYLTCSGALINNTAQDLTPYFLTAYHCEVGVGNAPTVVVYWNYENSTCRIPGSFQSGQPGDGSMNQFNTGAIFRAGYYNSDSTLLELDDPIDPFFNLFFAGWDRTSVNPSKAVGIHHPQVEEKRISFENDSTKTTSYYGNTSPGDGTHIRIEDWDLGTTEGGSSGSPLFNPDHRIVGQLHGGEAQCGNDLPDWYGRFSVSWNGGGTSDSRLKNWLDPGNTGASVLNGTYQYPDFSVKVTPVYRGVCSSENAVYSVTISSLLGFSDPVTLNLSGHPAGTEFDFSINPVTPSGSSILTISGTGSANAGSYHLALEAVSATSTHTAGMTLNIYDDTPGLVTLISPAQGAINQPSRPTFEWSSTPQGATYSLEIALDANFNQPVYTEELYAATTRNLPLDLESDTLYFWRVIPENSCGVGTPSMVHSFRTIARFCHSPHLFIPDADEKGVSDSIVMTANETLVDLDVSIKVTHTFVGDLQFILVHEDTGTEVTLIGEPYCDGEDMEVTLSDEATLPVQEECAGTIPAIQGTFYPAEPLSAFDGESFSGTWSLYVFDLWTMDTGTLDEWCLDPSFSGSSSSEGFWEIY